MTAFFADTFYWVALTSTEDPAHERAMVLSRSLTPDKIMTTDDVLCEYLAFFAGARPHVRFEAGGIVADRRFGALASRLQIEDGNGRPPLL